MLRKSIGALLISVALFSCQKKSEYPAIEQPTGWEIFETPIKSSLRGLSSVTADIVWASGSNGRWLKTLDAGQNWSHGIIDGLDSVDFRSIYGFDAENAIAVSAGQPAVIYKTSDGGKTWSKKHEENAKAFLDGISFTDKNRGYVFGDPIDSKWMILETTDQGETWTLIETAPSADEGEAGFAASASSLFARENELWLGSGGSSAKLYYSANRGRSWESWKSPVIQGEASQGVFSVSEAGQGEIVTVGGDYLKEKEAKANAAIFLTETQNWVIPSNPPSGYRSGVTYFPLYHWVIAVGPSGGDFSKDGGKNWVSFSEESWHAVSRAHSGGAIWASGAQGKIGRLTY